MKRQEGSVSFEANICQMIKYFVPLHNEDCSRTRMPEIRQHAPAVLLIGKASKRNLCAHAGVTVRKVKSGKFKLNRKERKWSEWVHIMYMVWIPLSYFFFYGFTRALLSGNVDAESPHHLYLYSITIKSTLCSRR